jgi:type IV fimbrial biogenesis protein FimT
LVSETSRRGIGAHRARTWRLRGDTRGFTLVELVVTGAVIAILTTIGVPVLIGVLSTSTASYGAREVQNAVSRAKQFAIATRQSICVQPTAGGLRFLQGGCGGVAWTGPDAPAGVVPITTKATLTASANPIFTQFGTVTQTGTFTVTATSGQTLTVTVWPSGRVTVP